MGKSIIKLIMAIVLFSNTSCTIEELAEELAAFECNALDLFGETSIALGFYENALNAYAEDQSAANCQELKESGTEYIEAVEAYRNCIPDGNPNIDSELDEAKAALADLEC